nr:embryo-specific protein ATS3B-like [Ipomoea batatas]
MTDIPSAACSTWLIPTSRAQTGIKCLDEQWVRPLKRDQPLIYPTPVEFQRGEEKISKARLNSIVAFPQPALPSFNINTTSLSHQDVGSCVFTVSISTSCSSPSRTRDQISLAFGDAYGNQVYAPRLDDPSTGTFERCSTDTYEISGPCTYQICYLYVYRSGYDGWIPYDVTVYGYYTKAVTFHYDVPIPPGIWYGFDYCSGGAKPKAEWRWSLLSVFVTILYTIAGLGRDD